MLVIAIIGILTATAIPQLGGFRQKKYFVIKSTNTYMYVSIGENHYEQQKKI